MKNNGSEVNKIRLQPYFAWSCNYVVMPYFIIYYNAWPFEMNLMVGKLKEWTDV